MDDRRQEREEPQDIDDFIFGDEPAYPSER